MPKPYRAVIIGTSSIANAHATALRAAGDRADIVAAADIVEDTVKSYCERHGIPAWYTDASEMLAATQPDLVHIATPPGTHFDLIMQSLEAGAWVYCEKPLCSSLAQFDEITKAEQRTGRYVNTVFQWRFGSAGKHVKHLIEADELGRPLVGLCQTLWYRGPAYYEPPWRATWAGNIGGVTATLGIHLMDLFLWLMGDWREVHALVETFDRPIEVDNVSMALVRFENDAMGNITNSAVSPRQESYLRLDFERATVECTTLYRYTNVNWRFTIPDGSPDADALAKWQTIDQDVQGSHDVQVAEMLDSMDRDERPFVNGPEARRILEFMASLYKSAFTGETVSRGSITPGDPFYDSMNGSLQKLER